MERRIFRLLLKFSFVFTNCKEEEKHHELPPAWQGIRVPLLKVGKHHMLSRMLKLDQAKLREGYLASALNKIMIGTYPVSSTQNVHNIL